MPSTHIFYPDFKWGGVTTLRQTYGFSGVVNSFLWTPNPSLQADYIVSTNLSALPMEISFYPLNHRILVVCENQAIYKPSSELMNSFGIIISPFQPPLECSSRWIRSHPAIPWFYDIEFRTDQGLLHLPESARTELGALSRQHVPPKTKLLSMFTSAKSSLPGHQWRIQLASSLKARLGQELDLFGFGFNPTSNKREGLDAYKFSIVVENDEHSDYWSEKLSDALLARCIPIYAGCPNINEYFSLDDLTIEFGTDVDSAVEKVFNIIHNYDPPCCDGLIEERRNQVLFRYNLMYMVPSVILSL